MTRAPERPAAEQRERPAHRPDFGCCTWTPSGTTRLLRTALPHCALVRKFPSDSGSSRSSSSRYLQQRNRLRNNPRSTNTSLQARRPERVLQRAENRERRAAAPLPKCSLFFALCSVLAYYVKKSKKIPIKLYEKKMSKSPITEFLMMFLASSTRFESPAVIQTTPP